MLPIVSRKNAAPLHDGVIPSLAKETAMSTVQKLAVVAILVLAAGSVQAGDRRPYAPGYAPNYGYQVNNYYGGWTPGYYNGSANDFSLGAQRIKAAHSRYRYFTHPMSLQNSPPTQADYFGWDWGY
jgi:hypothetical protein